MTTIYTSGHSRHPAERLVELLRAQEVSVLTDVRSHPASKSAPQFGKAALAQMLAAPRSSLSSPGESSAGARGFAELHRSDGGVDYDRRAQAPEFKAGVDRLVALAQDRRAAIMCAEEDPALCHRRLLVTRALKDADVTVLDVRGAGRIEPEDAATPHRRGSGSSDEALLVRGVAER